MFSCRLPYCIALMFRAVQYSAVQAVHCTNFKSTSLICAKGLFTNYVSGQRGGGGWKMLTMADEGVRQMLTLADKGG